jgi:MFS superfamily sulfate permease-like transporter
MMRLNMLGGLLPFKPREALKDAFAGVTLASMNIPQVLGYTRIAGTPVVTGLYTVLLPLVAFAVFGSSRHLVVAADSATAAIFSSSLSRMAPLASEKYMALVGMLTLLTAGLLLLARVFKLGFLADFLSRTVLVGFLTGVGIQVGIAMLGGMLGVNVISHRTLGQLWEVVRGAPALSPQTTALSIFVVASILLGRRFAPRFPVSLVVVVGTIAASAWFHLSKHGFAVIGPVPGGLPSLKWPDANWRETLDLLPVAGSCFVMIIAQSAATSRVYATIFKERVDEDADILGIAAANAAAAVSGAFVVNGSPTQTAMADQAGARSQVAQLAFAAVVLVVLLFLTGPLQYLPHCVLASIVFTIAVGMVNVQGLSDIRRESPGEFLGAFHRSGRAGDRRRTGHSSRDRSLACPTRPPQLPAAYDGARSGRDRPVGAGAGHAWFTDRTGTHHLSVRRGPVLRQRRSLRRRGALSRRQGARVGPVVRARRRHGDRP